MHRIRVRTADESKRRDVMRRHHARIARMELIRPSTPCQFLADHVDALGHDQNGPLARLREKVAEWAIETPCEHDSLSLLRNECKRAFELAHAVGVECQQPPLCLHVTDAPETPVSYTHLRAHETPEHLVCR